MKQLIVLWLILLAGCGADHQESGRAAVQGAALGQGAAVAKGAGSEGQERPETVQVGEAVHTGPLADPATWTTAYDFLRHLEAAEYRADGALHVDFGGPGAAKYTLGGWLTQVGKVVTKDGTRALVLPKSSGRIVLPFDKAGTYQLTVHVLGLTSGSGTVYLENDTLGALPLDGKTFGAVTVAVPIAGPGERTIQFRAPGLGRLADGTEAGLLLSSLTLSPPGSTAKERSDAPSVDQGALTLPQGWSVSFDAEVPAGAHLRVAGNAPARITVTRDGAAAVSVGAAGNDTDADLGAFAGRIVRVQIAAEKGAVSLSRAGLYLPGRAAAVAGAPHVKNVLVYLIDTLRADRMNVHNPKTVVKSPGMDLVARRAAVFSQGHTQENWTKPSVATLLSGLMPWQHTATSGDAVVPSSVSLVSERLGEKGFYTGCFIANGYVSDKFGFNQGWNTYRNYIREGRRTQANFVAADVLEWLDKRPKEKPFFLYVHTIDPHVPYIPPDSYLKAYDPDPYEGPVNFVKTRDLLENVKIGKIRLNDRDKTHLEALYDAEITFHDVHMHSIMQGLEKRGLSEDTMVVFVADHGEEFFDHGSVGHGHSVWEELLHIPYVMRIPGLTEGRTESSSPAGLVDVLPTIYDVLGYAAPEGLPGRSLLPVLRGETDAPTATVSGFMDGWRAMLIGHHKLIHRTASKFAMYDLSADPKETKDLAATSPIAVRYLRGQLGLTLAASVPGTAGGKVVKASKTTIDAATEAQLRALGYVGTSSK